jgi:hypothetical protein
MKLTRIETHQEDLNDVCQRFDWKTEQKGYGSMQTGQAGGSGDHPLFALVEARKLNARCFEAKVHNNLGIVYELGGSFAKARHAYGEALKIYEAKVGLNHPSSAKMARSLDRLSGKRAMHVVPT